MDLQRLPDSTLRGWQLLVSLLYLGRTRTRRA
jgi:hypothetical protein